MALCNKGMCCCGLPTSTNGNPAITSKKKRKESLNSNVPGATLWPVSSVCLYVARLTSVLVRTLWSLVRIQCVTGYTVRYGKGGGGLNDRKEGVLLPSRLTAGIPGARARNPTHSCTLPLTRHNLTQKNLCTHKWIKTLTPPTPPNPTNHKVIHLKR